jgi:hypothetical protein
MAPEPLVLHTSRLRLTVAYLGPTALVAIAIGGMIDNARFSVVALVVLVVGAAIGAVAALDYPCSSRFGPDGIARRCLVRVPCLPWSSVDALTRSADMWVAARTDLPGASRRNEPLLARRRPPGGLVAMRGRRRYLLVGQVESRAEFECLVRGLAEWAPSVTVLAESPPEDIAPTTIFRRSR